jgi:hypothetical protein
MVKINQEKHAISPLSSTLFIFAVFDNSITHCILLVKKKVYNTTKHIQPFNEL